MTNPSERDAHLKDTTDLYDAIASGNLPAVSYVKPSTFTDGHPSSSKFSLFEAYTKDIIQHLQANPELWRTTAIFVTVDEGGGYYDSGYVQPVDYFGDGTRIPLIIVSPYSRGGHVAHQYSRPRLDREIHRAQLASAACVGSGARQPAQSGHLSLQPLCAAE